MKLLSGWTRSRRRPLVRPVPAAPAVVTPPGTPRAGLTVGDSSAQTRQEWLRVAYVEAWNQYTHEDNLAVQRNSVFIIVQTALLAALATIVAALLEFGQPAAGTHAAHGEYLVIGILLVIFSLFARGMLKNWEAVSASGSAYVSLRFYTCLRIERIAAVEGVSLADLEYELKNAMTRGEDSFAPLSGVPGLTQERIGPLGTDGWESVQRLAGTLRLFWTLILVGGVLVLAGGVAAIASTYR